MCPHGAKLLPSVFPQEVGCHVLLIETSNGLVLVDTGLGEQDFDNPKRLGIMRHFLGIKGNRSETAVQQIRKLGFSPRDVRHIIPTHLDLDHAGGIVDFPNAKIHTLRREFDAAMNRDSFISRNRYRSCHWTSETKWAIQDENYGEDWFGFKAVREIPDLPPEILLIPLFGHTKGHFGVAIQSKSKWLLHAGDAYYDYRELSLTEKPGLGLRLFQAIVHDDYRLAMLNQKRLKQLSLNHPEIEVFCAHDPVEFRRQGKLSD